MAIWDLFSKREKRRARQAVEDVFQYDDLPQAFRIQVAHLFADALGRWRNLEGYYIGSNLPKQWWYEIHRVVAKEKGLFRLAELGHDPFYSCQHYLLNSPTTDALDLVEVAFSFVDTHVRSLHPGQR